VFPRASLEIVGAGPPILVDIIYIERWKAWGNSSLLPYDFAVGKDECAEQGRGTMWQVLFLSVRLFRLFLSVAAVFVIASVARTLFRRV
jgi:hypothetical protein